jgi:hypothetical protein
MNPKPRAVVKLFTIPFMCFFLFKVIPAASYQVLRKVRPGVG